MAIRGFMESTLSTSEVWEELNTKSDGTNYQNQAVNLIQKAKHLTNEDIEASYISVRQITDTLTQKAVRAFDNGQVVLLYNPNPSMSMTQALPFITFKTAGTFKTFMFIDKYVSMNRDGVLHMQPAVLRDLLTSGAIACGLKNNYHNLIGNSYLQEILMDIYGKLFTRVINREFSIASDKTLFERIRFYINKFFLEIVFGSLTNKQNINTLASNHFKYTDEVQANEALQKYEIASIVKLSGLLDLIKEESPRMRTLGLGLFLNDWINYYYAPSMLAVDNIEYVIFMIIALLSGSNIVNISAGDIVKEQKNIRGIRTELLKLIV